MPQAQIGHIMGFVAANVGTGASLGNKTNLNGADVSASAGLDNDNMDTVTTMDTRLIAIDATFYTQTRLDTMTYNDKVFAIRTNDNPLTIKQ